MADPIFWVGSKVSGVRIDATFGKRAGDVVKGGGDEFRCIKTKRMVDGR